MSRDKFKGTDLDRFQPFFSAKEAAAKSKVESTQKALGKKK